MGMASETAAGSVSPAGSSGRRSFRGRSFLPSVSDLIFIALIVALTCTALASRLLDDGGIGWHIRTGQIMLQTHALPRTDPFAVTMAGKTWFAWEWLFDVLAAAIHGWLGLNGIALFAGAMIAATFGLTLRTALGNGGSVPVTVVLLMLAIAASSIHFFARPHLVSWLMAVIWFSLLDRMEVSQARVRQLFWLPLLMVFWVNLHGGFLLGFVLLGIYLISAAVSYFAPGADKGLTIMRLKQFGIIAASSFAVSFINPFGYRLYVHIYQYLSDRFLMNHIDEFQSPNFHGFAQRCFAVLLLIAIASLATARKKAKLSHLLIAAFAVYSALYASRNLPVSSLLLVLVIAPILSRQISEFSNNEVARWLRTFTSRYEAFSLRMTQLELRGRWNPWSVAGFAFLLLICLHGGCLGARQLMDVHFRDKRFPVQAVNLIARSNIHEPIFTPDYWGGYLIYRLYPRNKVFIDDRHDLYRDQLIKDYMQIVFVQPDWANVLDKEGVNWVLAPSESSLANILRLSPAWKITQQDSIASLFQRTRTGGS